MSERPTWRTSRIIRWARPAAIIGLGGLALYAAYIIVEGHDGDPLPDPRLHTVVLTTLGMLACVGVGGLCFAVLRRGQVGLAAGMADMHRRLDDLEELVRRTDLRQSSAMAKLHSEFVAELKNRDDVSTDQIRLMVRAELAGAGGADVIRMPSSETREAFRNIAKRINMGSDGDTSGDIWSGRNARE